MEQTAMSRDMQVDCIKGSLIILVVFGHFVEVFKPTSVLMAATWAVIYSFHMPLFVLVSGLFVRAVLTEKSSRSTVERIILPLIFFQILYIAAYSAAKGVFDPASVLKPFFALWFLLSLVIWRCLAPVLVKLPGAVLISVFIALMAGYSPDIGYGLSLSRTVYFMPFFLIGMQHGKTILAFATRHRAIAAALFFASVALVLFWVARGLDMNVLSGVFPYAESAAIQGFPATGRMVVMLLSLGAAIGFAAIVPTSSRFLAWLGSRTMAIYLLHAFVVFAIRAAAKHVHFGTGVGWLVAWLALAVSLSVGLALLQPALDTAFSRIYELLRGGSSDTNQLVDARS